jgi:broad specificity phosphatase PhoE
MCRHTLYLVRHGQYETTEDHELGGGLTSLGRQQVECVATALGGIPFQALYTSPLRRAVETAYLIAPHFMDVQVQIIEGLREMIPCIPPERAEEFATELPEWTQEKVIQARKTTDETFDRLFYKPEEEDLYTLIVAHGNIINYFICRLLNVPCEKWLSFELNHCSFTRCAVGASGRMKLLSYNDIGHLPIELRLLS